MTWYFPYGVELIFRHPERLWITLIIPLLLLLVWWEIGQRKLVLRDPWLMLHLPVLVAPSWLKRIIWWVCTSVALILMILGLAIPERKSFVMDPIYGKLRLTFIFDTSLSMKRAEDVQPNRLHVAKDMVATCINLLAYDAELKGRYPLALIPFAGVAQPFFLPFTTSREEFLASLDEINERTISHQGTSVLAAILAYRGLLKSRPPREETTDIAILISDGDQEEGTAGERNNIPAVIREIYDDLKKGSGSTNFIPWHMVISTVGIGSVEIDAQGKHTSKPVALIIRDGEGNFLDFYRENFQDPQSPILKSRLDEEILREIARHGEGVYYHFTDKETLTNDFRKLLLKHRKVVNEIPHVRYEPVLSWFLAPAFVLWYFLFDFGDWLVRIFYGCASLMGKHIFTHKTTAP